MRDKINKNKTIDRCFFSAQNKNEHTKKFKHVQAKEYGVINHDVVIMCCQRLVLNIFRV